MVNAGILRRAPVDALTLEDLDLMPGINACSVLPTVIADRPNFLRLCSFIDDQGWYHPIPSDNCSILVELGMHSFSWEGRRLTA
jgi:hypothetical protein